MDLTMSSDQVEVLRTRHRERAEHFHQVRKRLMSCVDDPCGLPDGRRLPYASLGEVQALQGLGRWLQWRCPVIGSLINKHNALVLGGRELSFEMNATSKACSTQTVNVDDINCQLRGIVEFNDFDDIIDGVVDDPLIEGEVMLRVSEDKGDIHIEALDTTMLSKPSNPRAVETLTPDQIAERAPYGILYAGIPDGVDTDGNTVFRDDYKRPLRYYFKTPNGEVENDAKEIVFQKHGVGSKYQRGVNPWVRVQPNSMGVKELQMGGRDFALRLAEYAVVERLPAGVSNAKAKQHLAASQKAEADRVRRTGERFAHGAKKVTGNIDTITGSLAMGAGDIIMLTEKDQLMVGSQIDAPDVVTLQRSDMGARDTAKITIGPWWSRGRKGQRKMASVIVEALWLGLKLLNKWSDETVAQLKKAYRITVVGLVDPETDRDAQFNRVRDAFDRKAASRKQLAISAGLDYNAEEICEDDEQSCFTFVDDETPPRPPGQRVPPDEDDPPTPPQEE